VDPATCNQCPKRQEPSAGHYEKLDPKNVVEIEHPVPEFAARGEYEVIGESGPKPPERPRVLKRSPLADIANVLPPFKEGRDRKVRFEDDGTIVYEKQEGEWEPPKDIDGYERDPENPWRFKPLWPLCCLRHQIGVRFANCGCIGVIMRCSNPQATKYLDRVSHHDCEQCPFRQSTD
jgi:hypothetical protein